MSRARCVAPGTGTRPVGAFGPRAARSADTAAALAARSAHPVSHRPQSIEVPA